MAGQRARQASIERTRDIRYPTRTVRTWTSCLGALPLLLSSAGAQAGDTWSNPHPGVRYLYRTTSYPRRIVATQVDLCAPGVSVRATQSSERKRTPSSFAKLVGAKVAVNGDFFSYQTYGTSGLSVGNGNRWTDTKDGGGSGFLAFGFDRNAFSPPPSVVDPPPEWMRDVVSGNLQVLTDGVPLASDSGDFCTTRHPRTVAGFSRDRRTLILAVVDGRTSTAVGMRCSELGALMKELGAWDAINFDGGGSSAMYLDGKGVVNHPSDGSERVTGNQLAVLASGKGEPGSCDRSFEESTLQGDAYEASTTTDIDGDGKADVCARGGAGITCALSTGTSFGVPFGGPALSDASGWSDESNYATLRMGDLNGDGKADLCARGNAGVTCWLSDGKGFPKSFDGPALADDQGWNRPEYYGTLRIADINGDGRDDLCARASKDLRCYPSTGSGFGPAVVLSAISDDKYGEPGYYGTLRVGDVTGDGKADVCIRGAGGITCWPSTGTGFGAAIAGPAWSDAGGWNVLQYWSTIRLVDVNGDGKADLCARAAKGVVCSLSTGKGFGAAIDGPSWSDDSGWYRHRYHSTLRFADLDGDGDLEVCGRGAAGIVCAPWTGSGFGATFSTGRLSDDAGWSSIAYYGTIHFADVTGDGKADLCARGASGFFCWGSNGKGFPTQLDGPNWSDAQGWSADPRYYSTIRVAGPKCRATEICGNGLDDDCSGVVDDGCGPPSGNGGAGGSGGTASAGKGAAAGGSTGAGAGGSTGAGAGGSTSAGSAGGGGTNAGGKAGAGGGQGKGGQGGVAGGVAGHAAAGGGDVFFQTDGGSDADASGGCGCEVPGGRGLVGAGTLAALGAVFALSRRRARAGG